MQDYRPVSLAWLYGNAGAVCVPNGPCLVPVWPGIMAPSGVLMVGDRPEDEAAAQDAGVRFIRPSAQREH